MEGRGRAFALPPGGGRDINLETFVVTVKASGGDTTGSFSLLETGKRKAGPGPPLHVHHDAAEAFYVLEGEYAMLVEEREIACPAGSFVFIPAGIRHTFSVSATPSRKLNFYFPAAMVGYFDDLASAIARGDVGERALDEIARKHSMKVVGPVPEDYV